MEGAGRGTWKGGIRAVVDSLVVKQTWGKTGPSLDRVGFSFSEFDH